MILVIPALRIVSVQNAFSFLEPTEQESIRPRWESLPPRPVNEEYADKGKSIFTPGQLHKVVFDIKNPDEQDVSASEYNVID